MADANTQWKKIGSLTTTPDGVLSPVNVQAQQTYVVVGFGVNEPKAFQNGVHYIGIDPGHAFMYTVRNNKVTQFLSFGPIQTGNLRNAAWGPGTPDFGMSYATNLFKVEVSMAQMNSVEKITAEFRQLILSGDMPYKGLSNDTCAETVKEILDKAGVTTPNGKGPVGHALTAPLRPKLENGQWPSIGSTSIPINTNMGVYRMPVPTINTGRAPDLRMEDVTVTPSITAVNPYKWYDGFKKSGKYKEVRFAAQKEPEDYWSFDKRAKNPDPLAGRW